jgi:bifunctional pyridoxal-dependent enzyme with beta-cystathionase and maltose regulon repressor activities
MTTEQKAKAYDEAIERAKGFKTDECRDVAEYIFPELKETKEDRIIKAIKNCIKKGFIGYGQIEGVIEDDCLAWLEKQGEKKPMWSEEDDYNVQCCIAKAERDITNGYPGRNKELIEWLKQLKQRMEE